MKIEIDDCGKYSVKYLRSMLLSTVREVSANPVLKSIIEAKGYYTWIEKDEGQELVVVLAGDGDESARISSYFGSELEVQLPETPQWHRHDVCSPLSVVEIPDWIRFILGKDICSSESEWFVNLGANFMRLDVIAELLKMPVEDLMALKFVASDGSERSAISAPRWDSDPTSSGLADIRAVMAALAMARFDMDA